MMDNTEKKQPTQHEVLRVLRVLAEQVDEDCPAEYRTRHLVDALEDAYAMLGQYDQRTT